MHSINIQPMQNNGGNGRLTAHKTAIEKTHLKPLRVDSGVRAAQAEAPKSSAAQGQLAALCKTLGLPADRLSHSIISFAKFFSLPLEPRMLLNVRKASLAQTDSRAPAGQIRAGADSAAILNSRQAGLSQQALALAALAAADKGVSLSPAALRDYAAAIDPDRKDMHGGQPDGGGDAEDRGNAQRDATPDQRDGGGRKGDAAPADPAPLLKEQFCKSAGPSLVRSSPALDLLNRLPGRNGRRWLAFPLSFTKNGVQVRVSLRILLDGDSGASYAVRRMSLDIARRDCELSGTEQRWLFILDREKPDSEDNGNSLDKSRLTVLLRPPRPHGALKSLAKKLSRCMDLPIERITIKNYRDSDFAADSRDDVLPIINKEV